MSLSPLGTLAGIGLLAIACQWLAWRVKLPAILFLLLAGIVAGPVTGWLDPNALFGELLFPFVSLAVAVILFEGSLTLRFDEIRGLQRVVRNLVTIGVLVTWLVTALATHYLLGFSWELAFLFGAISVVTGPTVIVPMLRTVRPKARVASVLRWEGIMIDPIGALLVVLVYEFIVSGQGSEALGHTLATFGLTVLTGAGLGAAAAYGLGQLLRRHWIPDYLQNIATLTLVFGVFALSDRIEHESGLLAVTVMGMWLANMRGVAVREILDFKESLSILLISGLFIILAARVELEQLYTLGWSAVMVLLVIQFIARPLKVGVSAFGSNLSWRERALLAWIAPRGIVAAAVSALFALKLEERGYEQAQLLVPLTFLVIIGTVTLQSATARVIAKLLHVAEPEPRGLLIIGANRLARDLAKCLRDQGFHTLLVDTYWENIRAARMEGLATYYGNPLSEHADAHLDLVGIGRMLGLSPMAELNALAAQKFRGEFGANGVYTLQTTFDRDAPEKLRIAAEARGYILFGSDITYSSLAARLDEGSELRVTRLTEAFDFDDYRARHGPHAIPMFAIDPRERLHVFVNEGELRPAEDWIVIGLVLPREETPRLRRSMNERVPGPADPDKL
jgi:CPA1 family monovalent cation:H+ antiporter